MSAMVFFLFGHHHHRHLLCSPIPRSLQSASEPVPSSYDLKLRLLQQENFSPSHVRLLEKNRNFLSVSYERLASFISFLQAKGLSGPQASCILSRTPALLRYRVETIEDKCKFFQDVGMQRPALQRILMTYTRSLLTCSTEIYQKRVDFLLGIGLNKQELGKLIARFPLLFCSVTDRKMKAKIAFLEQHGLRRAGFLKLVRAHPQVFGYSIDRYLTKKLEFLRGLGLDVNSSLGAKAFTIWISLSSGTLLSRWEMLKNQGFSESDARKLVLGRPEILTLKEDRVKPKIHYFKTVLNRDLQELARCPTYLCLSFENRIVPRFTFVNQQKEGSKHASKKEPSWQSILKPSDEVFEMRYATGYGNWKAQYLKEKAGAGKMQI